MFLILDDSYGPTEIVNCEQIWQKIFTTSMIILNSIFIIVEEITEECHARTNMLSKYEDCKYVATSMAAEMLFVASLHLTQRFHPAWKWEERWRLWTDSHTTVEMYLTLPRTSLSYSALFSSVLFCFIHQSDAIVILVVSDDRHHHRA